MTRLLGIAVSAVLLLGTTQFAEAAYPCAEGFTLQDGFCKPYRGPYEGYGYRYATATHLITATDGNLIIASDIAGGGMGVDIVADLNSPTIASIECDELRAPPNMSRVCRVEPLLVSGNR